MVPVTRAYRVGVHHKLNAFGIFDDMTISHQPLTIKNCPYLISAALATGAPAHLFTLKKLTGGLFTEHAL
jgi:hypothetical protein